MAEVKSKKLNIINIDKFYIACPDGVGYEFQEHKTDILLRDIFKQNEYVLYLEKENRIFLKQYKRIKKIVNEAEKRLHCCCDITEMLINIETIVDKILKRRKNGNKK